MAVFRRIFDITKAALFALMFVFVSVFPQNTLADAQTTPDYFLMKVVLGTDYTFDFTMSAAGCYEIYWECDNIYGEGCQTSGLETKVINRASGDRNYDAGTNIKVSRLKKTYAEDLKITKRYPSAGGKTNYFIKIQKSNNCQTNANEAVYQGYNRSNSAISFVSMKGGVVGGNTALRGIYGSLGAVFPTITNDQPRTEAMNGQTDTTEAVTQPNFLNAFYGCNELGGTIPETLFSGITGRPVDNMFAGTFAGCKKLEGSIHANLFSGLSGGITAGMFNGTFYGCENLTGNIPQGLFSRLQGIVKTEMFMDTFRDCKKLEGIPSDLFLSFGTGNYADTMRTAENAYKNTFKGCTGIKYLYNGGNTIHYIPRSFLGYVKFQNDDVNSEGKPKNTDGMFEGVPNYDNSDPDNIIGIAEVVRENSDKTPEQLCLELAPHNEGDNVTALTGYLDKGFYRVEGDANTRKLICNVSNSHSVWTPRVLKFYSNCENGHINEYGVHQPGWQGTVFTDETCAASDTCFTAVAYDGRSVPQKKSDGEVENNDPITAPASGSCPGYTFAGYRRITKDNNGNYSKIKDGFLHYDSLLRIDGKWETIIENSGEENETLYLELYADWKPNVYTIQFDNRATLPGHASLKSGIPVTSYLYEKYRDGLYRKFSEATVDVSDKITDDILPIPSATGAVFLGYAIQSNLTNEYIMVTDANGKLINYNDPEYSNVDNAWNGLYNKTITTNNMVFQAMWAPTTLLYFQCKNRNNVTINIPVNVNGQSVSVVELPGNSTEYSSNDFPTLAQIKSLCKSDVENDTTGADWDNPRKALAWDCTGASTPEIYHEDDNNYNTNLQFAATAYEIKCSVKNKPKIYKIILDDNRGDDEHNIANTTHTIYLSGIPDWKTSSNKGAYHEYYYTDINDALGATSNITSQINGISSTPTRPIYNKYATFNGYYDAEVGGNVKLSPPTPMMLPSPDDQEYQRSEFSNWETTWYAHYENPKTEYIFKCHVNGTPARSGFIENNLLPSNYNYSYETGQHACLGGSSFSAHEICNVPREAQYTGAWECWKTTNENGTETTTPYNEPIIYDPDVTPVADEYCQSNQIKTDGLTTRVLCVAKSLPPSYLIKLRSFATNSNSIYADIYEKYGIDFYNSTYVGPDFDTAWSNHDPDNNQISVHKIVNIFRPNQEQVSDSELNAISEGDHGICASGTNFIGYYPGIDGTIVPSNGETPISYNTPYINYNGNIMMTPLAFDKPVTLAPSCLRTGNYYLSFYCSEENEENSNTPRSIDNMGVQTYQKGVFSAPVIDKQSSSDVTSAKCPAQQLDKVNNGDWKCKIYTFNSTKQEIEPASTVNYRAGGDITGGQQNWWNDVYRIDCFAQWHDNNLEIKLHSGDNTTDTGTEKLYSVFGNDIYHDSNRTISATNLLEYVIDNEGNKIYRYQEPLRDMYLFDGYFDKEDNANDAILYITPRRNVVNPDNPSATLYNLILGDSAKDKLLYTPHDTDLYAHWKRIYKINLNIDETAEHKDSNGKDVFLLNRDSYLKSVYTDGEGVYADELFYNSLGNTSSTITFGEGELPERRGYNLVGYVNSGGTKMIENVGFNLAGRSVVENIASNNEEVNWTAVFEPQIINVQLNINLPTGTTDNDIIESGTANIYKKYDYGFYADQNAQTSISSITIPQVTGYTFAGYVYTDPHTQEEQTCVYENGEIVNNNYEQDRICLAKWNRIDCSIYADKYFDAVANACVSCPAKYPEHDVATDGELERITQCFMTVNRYTKIGDNISSPTTERKYYDAAYADGVPLSSLTETASPMGYNWNSWHATGNDGNALIENTYKLYAPDHLDIYEYYTPKNITYNLFCKDEDTTSFASGTGTFNTAFDIGAYESNLPSTCSDVFDKNEFVTWKCYSTNPNSSVESKNSVIWNTDEGPVNCYAQWEPYVFQVDMYSNATDLINTIYVKYGAGYYKDLEAQTPIVIPDDTKPSRPSYRFQGYCLEPNTQNCTRMIDEFGDINSTEFGTTNARFSKTQTLGAPINLYAVWQFIRSAIELDNDGIYPNGSATKPMEALFIDVDGKNVSVDSHFEPDQIIGNANSNTNIVIPKEYLPTLKIGEQYYAFNGYKHGDTDVVDSNGLILPAGIQEIQNFSQDNPITWVAQWVPIYKVVLKVNQNQGTLGSFTEFYTDKTGVYSDIYLINNNTENNTYIGSVANGTTLLNSAEQYPSRTGYNFAGFDNNISADGKLTSAGAQAIQNFNNPVATWTAQWESKIVKIILTDAIHGTNNNPIWEKYGVGFYDNSSVSGNVINGIPSVPSVEGYTFDGFYPSSSAVEPYITSSGTINMGATTFDGESEEVELYARWTPNQYTVYFDKNGGEGYMEDRQVFTYDTPGNLNTNGYSKTGHTFIGWCVGQTQCETTDTTFKADGAEVINLTTGSGITLYAKWEPITYRIEFSGGANGVCDIATGEGTDYNPITYGSGVTLPQDGCSRTGYNLIGWSLAAGCPSISDSNFIELGGHHADFTTTNNATVMIYACWNGITYTVHFDANGGTGTIPDQTNVSYNAPITLPRGQDLLSKEGHNCVGWCVGTRECENYKADGSSASELTTESEVTLYAKWETSSYNITYMVDGVNTPDVVAENNSYLYSEQEQTKTPTQPTKTGFKFVGWCKTSDVNSGTDCSPTITIEARAHEPKTYYAKWEYRNIICQPGYYLPAGSEVCAPCDKDTEPSMNGWCPGTPEGETWHINYNENQGIAQCPAIINDTGAAVVIPDYMVDSRTIDFNGNDLKDVEGDCGAVFVYSNDTRNVGKKVETKLGRNLINSNPINTSYDSSKPLNQNVVWAAANCWYNETSQRYDKCLPADWMGVVCANGYYIPQNKLHTNIASMTTYSEFENICEQAQEEYYTNLYDRHKGDVDATNTMLASKVGVAVVNGGYKDVISNTDELFDSLYKKCRPEYRHTDDRGSWKITDCYAIVEYRNSRDELLYEQEKHEFSGSSNGTIIQADFYHINRAEPDLIANYEFGGWYREKRYRDSQYLVDTSTDLVGDVRLYPYYEQSARSMTIEFRNSVDVPVENIPEPITCFLGDECVYYCGGDGETPCPERNEYDPVAWNLSIDGSGDSFPGEERENGGYKYDLSSIFDYVLLDDHSILYAIWTPTEYQIEYVLKDGEAENPSSYNIKTPTFTLNNPVKQGNTFVGWCVNEDNCADANRYMTYELPNNFVERNKDVPLVMYAMYEPMPYRVDFNENGGEGTKGSIFCRYGEECDVTNYNDVVWEGHEFLGWDRNQNAFTPEFPLGENGKIYVNILTETPNERVALYAIWSRDDIDIRYVYNDESNTVSITTCKMSNGTFNLPVLQNYLRPGYRFFGWRVSDGTDVNDGSQVISYISDYTQDQCYEAGLSWCVSSKRNPLTGVVDITEKCASSCGPNDLEVIPDSN